MTAPHCPAVLLVARHAEAEYEGSQDDGADDESGQLTPPGREQAARLATALQGRRIAAAYSSVMGRAAQTAMIVADRLAVLCAQLAGIEECADGESEASVLGRFRAALEEVADQHPGETVLVVSHGGAMSVALPRLCDNVTEELSRARWLAHCASVEVQIGAEGWLLGRWPGSLDPAVAEQSAV